MARWSLFGAAVAVLALAFVLLARRSAAVLHEAMAARDDPEAPAHPAAALLESDRLLVGNVLASHGVMLGLLAATVYAADVPLHALGLTTPAPTELGVGVVLGLALAAANEAAARLAERTGLDRDERLRELLAPDSRAGWLALLAVVLPLVAAAEELLFRAALIGGLGAGFGLDPWLLVAGSSVMFGLGHGLQGRAGVAVTAGLGLALGAAFVLTGSFAVVAVAHYLVNAIEFLANERPA